MGADGWNRLVPFIPLKFRSVGPIWAPDYLRGKTYPLCSSWANQHACSPFKRYVILDTQGRGQGECPTLIPQTEAQSHQEGPTLSDSRAPGFSIRRVLSFFQSDCHWLLYIILNTYLYPCTHYMYLYKYIIYIIWCSFFVYMVTLDLFLYTYVLKLDCILLGWTSFYVCIPCIEWFPVSFTIYKFAT